MEPPVQVYWVPKLGNSAEEYEDAAAFSLEQGRFAIADGATESSFSDLWARSLVRQYTTSPPLIPPNSAPLHDWLVPLQTEWHGSINWERLPWFAEEKARNGAFAAFLGLYFLGADKAPPPPFSFWGWVFRRRPRVGGVRWHALAVGDSCLFQVRGDKLLSAFPISESGAFNDRPLLISSNPSRNHPVWKAVQFAEGECQPGDMFILGTDALSKWFLQEREAGNRPWETLVTVQTQASFATFVDALRQQHTIRNDDTTLLQFTWPIQPPPAGTKEHPAS